MITQEITAIILTKSAKHHNYCVAGINCDTGEFVRFVSDDADTVGALTKTDLRYSNAYFAAEPLHLVRVSVKGHVPGKFQTENYLIDRSKKWYFIKKVALKDVLQLHEPETHKNIFGNYSGFSFTGNLRDIRYSLILIWVTDLKLYRDGGKTKADFRYNGARFTNFSVTDENFFDIYKSDYPQAYLVISIPETPIQGNVYYKFIAKIFA